MMATDASSPTSESSQWRHRNGRLMWLVLSAMTIPAAMLVWQQVASVDLPGCGPTSACASLSETRWGRIAGIPASILGLGYCAGLLMASAPRLIASRPSSDAARDGLPRKFILGTVTIGGLVSLFYLALMSVSGRWCVYCLWFHLANLAFVGSAWKSGIGFQPVKSQPDDRLEAYPTYVSLRTAAFRFIASFAAVVLIGTSIQRFVDRSADIAAQNQTNSIADRVISELTLQSDSATTPPAGFTGRHARGPEMTAARLVVFQDYQCGDCQELEAELQQRLRQNSDLRVSLRQFPLCDDCNSQIHYSWFHPNACRAAKIAEAVMEAGGEDAFWKANEWLFTKKGMFEDADIDELAELVNLAPLTIRELADSELIAQRLAADIDEGISLGVSSAPFVFLNGVAIEGAASDPANVATALDKIEAEVKRRKAAGEDVARYSPSHDPRPPKAADRIIRLWSESEPVTRLPDPASCQHVLGNPDATNRVVLFLEPTYSDAGGMWRILRRLAELSSGDDAANLRIELYLYPISRELNPRFAERDRDYFPRSTATTTLLKAVQAISNDSAFDDAMNWITTDGQGVAVEDLPKRLTQAIAGDRWTLEELETMMRSEQVATAIASDIQQADQCEITWAPNLIIKHRISPSDTVSAETVLKMSQQKL